MAGEVQQIQLSTKTILMSPLPAKMTPSVSEAALAIKFLEVCQELTIKGIHFTCTLTVGSTINLSLDTTEKEKKEESTPLARRKTSPSTTRRIARRKALQLNKLEEEKQNLEKSKVPKTTTAAAEASYKELGDDDSRRITTILKKKGVAQVEKPCSNSHSCMVRNMELIVMKMRMRKEYMMVLKTKVTKLVSPSQ